MLDVRRKYPFMGKARIQTMLARKGLERSVSTVGRIIEGALAAGAIRRASFCEGRQCGLSGSSAQRKKLTSPIAWRLGPIRRQ